MQRMLSVLPGLLFFCAVYAVPVLASPPGPFTIAFYYAALPPLDELQAFDIVVVEPDAVGVRPQLYKSNHSELFAYVSVGEADPQRNFYARIQPEWLIGDNPAWNSKLVDLSNPAWRDFFLDQVVEPLWKAGYRGFFLDTLDSYQLVKDKKRHPALESGLVQIIRSIKQRHPEARLILNRGFEVFDRVHDVAFAVAAESLFQKFDPITGGYGEVKEHDRQWLLGKFAQVKKAGLPVIAIDYVEPKYRELARKIAEKIKTLGFIPWVTDKDLASLGVGTVEVLPRKVVGFYDGSEAPDPAYVALQRVLVMPLNYLGYQVELHDMRKPLPAGIWSGRYAGVVVWPNSADSGKNGFLGWAKEKINEGVKFVFIERFGVPCKQFAKEMGLEYGKAPANIKKLKILSKSSEIGFEAEPVAMKETFCPVVSQPGTALLSTGDGNLRSDAVAITAWGGYALEPYFLVEPLRDQARLVTDPFAFLQKSLRLHISPAPDVSTENGVRLLLSHIDADGFESYVERPGGPLAATELRERILNNYRIPITFSLITSTMGDHGFNQKQAPELQAEARKIFSLPWIEAGSHTFSHPFYWQNTDLAKKNYSAQYLSIPNYQFSLDAEIRGSVSFMEQTILPHNKKVKLLQWSGDCVPGSDALRATYLAGIGNINGGDTKITYSNNSITEVAPMGVGKDGWFQVFAPNQNENVYTNDWRGPFYGYRRVIETFKLTDSPRRLKPINIYYHTYSVTKEASRRALEDVYDWALAQKPHAIFVSDYVNKVLDFNRTVVARFDNGWLIRNHGDLRQMRVPISAGYPDMTASSGVIGFSDHNDQRYIHLAPGGEAFLKMTAKPPSRAWLATAAARIDQFEWTSTGMKLSVTAHVPGHLRFGGASRCTLISDGKALSLQPEGALLSAAIPAGNHGLELVCR